VIKVKLRRNRYIIFTVFCRDNVNISFREILNSIFNSILSLFGEVGASKISFSLMRYYPEKRLGILRCDHLNLIKMRSALAFIKDIEGNNVTFRVIKVTGTFRKAEKILNSLSIT